MNLKKVLEQRRGLRPAKPRSKMSEEELESLASRIARTEVQRRMKPLKKKEKKSEEEKLLGKILGELRRRGQTPGQRVSRPRSEPSQVWYESLPRPAGVSPAVWYESLPPHLRPQRKKIPREIETIIGERELLQPKEVEKLIRKEKKVKPLGKERIESILLGKKKKKSKKKGGEMQEDVRFTVKNPTRLEGVKLFKQEAPPAEAVVGEGLSGAYDGNFNLKGSLNPPLDYGPLNYLANLPLGPRRASNVPWADKGDLPYGAGDSDDAFGGGEDAYTPNGAHNYYYQANDVDLAELERLMADSASLRNPYQLNNVSQPHLLHYPPALNNRSQGFVGAPMNSHMPPV